MSRYLFDQVMTRLFGPPFTDEREPEPSGRCGCLLRDHDLHRADCPNRKQAERQLAYDYPQDTELRRVAAEQDHPRLTVYCDGPGYWRWDVIGPHCDLLDGGKTATHAEALAVGLEALEVASRPGSVIA